MELPHPDDGIPSRRQRLSVASDAAKVGEVTKFEELIVESLAIRKGGDDDEKHDNIWSLKSCDEISLRSSHIQASMEAAALGLKTQLKPLVVKNYEDEQDEESKEKEVPKRGVLPSSSFLVNNFVERQKKERSKSLLPENILKSMREMDVSRKKYSIDAIASLPCKDLPMHTPRVSYLTRKKLRLAVPQDAAKASIERRRRIKEKNNLVVTKTCNCVYCKKASPFQTRSYQALRQSLHEGGCVKSLSQRNLTRSKEKWAPLTPFATLTPSLHKRKSLSKDVAHGLGFWSMHNTPLIGNSTQRNFKINKDPSAPMQTVASNEQQRPSWVNEPPPPPPPICPPSPDSSYSSQDSFFNDSDDDDDDDDNDGFDTEVTVSENDTTSQSQLTSTDTDDGTDIQSLPLPPPPIFDQTPQSPPPPPPPPPPTGPPPPSGDDSSWSTSQGSVYEEIIQGLDSVQVAESSNRLTSSNSSQESLYDEVTVESESFLLVDDDGDNAEAAANFNSSSQGSIYEEILKESDSNLEVASPKLLQSSKGSLYNGITTDSEIFEAKSPKLNSSKGSIYEEVLQGSDPAIEIASPSISSSKILNDSKGSLFDEVTVDSSVVEVASPQLSYEGKSEKIKCYPKIISASNATTDSQSFRRSKKIHAPPGGNKSNHSANVYKIKNRITAKLDQSQSQRDPPGDLSSHAIMQRRKKSLERRIRQAEQEIDHIVGENSRRRNFLGKKKLSSSREPPKRREKSKEKRRKSFSDHQVKKAVDPPPSLERRSISLGSHGSKLNRSADSSKGLSFTKSKIKKSNSIDSTHLFDKRDMISTGVSRPKLRVSKSTGHVVSRNDASELRLSSREGHGQRKMREEAPIKRTSSKTTAAGRYLTRTRSRRSSLERNGEVAADTALKELKSAKTSKSPNRSSRRKDYLDVPIQISISTDSVDRKLMSPLRRNTAEIKKQKPISHDTTWDHAVLAATQVYSC